MRKINTKNINKVMVLNSKKVPCAFDIITSASLIM